MSRTLFGTQLVVLFALALVACKKNKTPEVIIDSLEAVEQELHYTATIGYGDEEYILERGICWSESNALPTIEDGLDVDNDNETGTFSGVVSDLELNTTYNFRAYMKTSSGTDYSETVQFDLGKGWTILTPPTSNSYYTLWFFESGIGQVGGSTSSHYKTTDDGLSWEFIDHGFSGTVHNIFFVDDNVGYVYAYPNAIRKTTDGGASWTSLTYPASGSGSLTSIYFLSADLGYFTAGSYVYKTTDGGSTWTESSALTPTSQPMESVYFLDASIGYAASSAGRVWKTENGGALWVETTTSGVWESCKEIHFFNENTGIMLADNYIFKTYDGGVNWTQKVSDASKTIFTNMSFYDDQIGHAVGLYGRLVSTQDGGETWTEEWNPGGSVLYDVQFLTPELGYIVGSSGLIMKYE